MHDIETLITHFLGVSWGPVIPPGEACMVAEGSKGNHMYYLVSDGGHHELPDADPHAVIRAHPDRAPPVPGPDDSGPDGRSLEASTTSSRTSTGEGGRKGTC